MIKEAISKVMRLENLTEEEAYAAMEDIMSGAATPAQIGGYLTALKMKGETPDEICGSAQAMRAKAESISIKAQYCIDTCGTGGDGAESFNISTAAAFVAAAGGVVVAKHGNRSVSSRSGSADVLEALGVNINLSPAEVGRCIDGVGIGFLFAQRFHSSMKHAAGPRRELGVRTIFNLLGPITNPAAANGQLLGIYDGALTEKIAGVLGKLGAERALVLHGDGMDEISLSGETKISEWRDGAVRTYTVNAGLFGLPAAPRESVKGGSSAENAEIIRAVFCGKRGAQRDIVVLNAGAALYVGKKTDSIEDGVRIAEELIDSGRAQKKLEELIAATNAAGGVQ